MNLFNGITNGPIRNGNGSERLPRRNEKRDAIRQKIFPSALFYRASAILKKKEKKKKNR